MDPARRPARRFVTCHCIYAGEILNGHRPGPDTDDDARAYARALLIPAELLEPPRSVSHLDASIVGQWLGMPPGELGAEARSWSPLRRHVDR